MCVTAAHQNISQCIFPKTHQLIFSQNQLTPAGDCYISVDHCYSGFSDQPLLLPPGSCVLLIPPKNLKEFSKLRLK
ncbi:hypothetical protein P3S67_020842 [Capsicum chacoense]